MFLSFVFISIHFLFIFLHFKSNVYSCSFYIPFSVSPMCIHVLSSSFHLHACSFHFAFMSFHFQGYGNGSMAWPGDQVQQMVIAKLSLNNPSNIWHCLKEICHKNDRERERERERERASWMPNDMVTAGKRAPQVKFPSSVLPVLWMCTTVFSWFTPSLMDCRVWSQIIAFGWGPIALQRLKTPAILKWPSTIVTVTHTHTCIMYIYLYI